MLFKRRFHEGIRRGTVTRTIRTWRTPRVKVGGSYRLGHEDAVEVDAVESLTLAEIPAADAKRCGFATRDELIEAVRRHAKQRITARSKVYRVTFHHVRVDDPRLAKQVDTSASALDDVWSRLERMDRRSTRGPWTLAMLRLIEAHPRIAASLLAPRMERETRAFKADVRKLKTLGLTVSHEVGYSLSPRGRAVLRRST